MRQAIGLMMLLTTLGLQATSLSVENRFSEGKSGKSELVATLKHGEEVVEDVVVSGHVRVRDGEGYNKIDARLGVEYKAISYIRPYLFYDVSSKNSRDEAYDFSAVLGNYAAIGINGTIYKHGDHGFSYSTDIRFSDAEYTATRSYVKYAYQMSKDLALYTSIVRRRAEGDKYASETTPSYADTSGRIGLSYHF